MLRAHVLSKSLLGARLCDPPPRVRPGDERPLACGSHEPPSGITEQRDTCTTRRSTRVEPAGASGPGAKTNVLLLIAHPDDEAMFFVPSILAIAKEHTLFVMSASNGDYDGLGKTREEELKKSCALLQIPEERITILDDPGLQDGPKNIWDTGPLAFYLIPHIRRHNICAIITFDGHGVSGHPNHIALYAALRDLLSSQSNMLPRHLKLWALESVGIVRKFMGPLAVLEHDIMTLFHAMMTLLGFFKRAENERDSEAEQCITCCLNITLVRRCLLAHWSQAVWYRWIFIYLSRYSFVNRLVPIGVASRS